MKKMLALAAAAGLAMMSGVATAERPAADIYNSKCMACHANAIAGAPKTGDAAAWGPRMEKGIDALLASAKTGLNAMPPMGTCMDCTDAELKSAIEFMQPK